MTEYNKETVNVIQILADAQKENFRSNKIKDKIIVLLIVLMFLQAAIGYCGFVYYESQFEYTDTVTTETKETYDTDLSTSGDNANIEYNDTDYNDNAVHSESK